MKFPYIPTNVGHAHGGKITKVHGLSHKTMRPRDGYSRDYWFLDCDVQWADTDKVSRHEVEPFNLSAKDGGEDPEIRALCAAMDAYLREHGAFYDGKPHQGWYAHRKVGPVLDSTGRLMAAVGPQV